MAEITWVFDLKNKVTDFLAVIKSKKRSGFFHYSLSGDLYDEEEKWGLGNTVFAVKIYYTLGLLEQLPQTEKEKIANFINSFQTKNGTIFDPLIKRKTYFKDKLVAVKNFDFNNFWHKQTIVAETRQALSALRLLNSKPVYFFSSPATTLGEVIKYLENLDWTKPWGAGSHFSHLLFFLNYSNLESKEELIAGAVSWLENLQHKEDGCWYKGKSSLQQKINGAMKIITGLKVVNKVNFEYAQQLVDLCLIAKNDTHACDHFNIVYVLKYCNEVLAATYQYEEIQQFMTERLKEYQKFYYPEIGGFSFLPKRASMYYYGAKISSGLTEPDIHGTIMFLWGISLIAQVLNFNNQLQFNEQIS